MFFKINWKSRLSTIGLSMTILSIGLGASDLFAAHPKVENLGFGQNEEKISHSLLKSVVKSKSTNVRLSDSFAEKGFVINDAGLVLELVFEEGFASRLRGFTIPGAEVQYISDNLDYAYVAVQDPNVVMSLSQLQGLKLIRPSIKPETHVGAVESRAQVAHNVDRMRDRFLVDGREVDGRTQKIGILSDSFALTGGVRDFNTTPAAGEAGILMGALNQDSGDLPAQVEILLDLPASEDSIDEGAAMAELIHDMAPGAPLAFHTAFLGQASFADGIRRLWQEAGCTVVVDDVGYFTAPYYQDGVIAQAAREAVANGIPYFSSAGNSANNGLRFTYQDINPGVDDTSLFPTGNDFHQWPNGTGFLEVTVVPFNLLRITVQWNQPFESIPGSAGSEIDIDYYLFEEPDVNSPIVISSTDLQGTTGAPQGDAVEFNGLIVFDQTRTFYLAIDHFAGNQEFIPQNSEQPLEIGIQFIGALPIVEGITSDLNTVGGPTIFGHPVAEGVMSVGAVPWYDTTRYSPSFSPTNEVDPEGFTSLGGSLRTQFDDFGNYSVREFFEPDIAGIDGNNTTFFGGNLNLAGFAGEPDGFPNFFGTSAAAPNVAAIAALMKDINPNLTPAEVQEILQLTAIDIIGRRAAPGFDDTTGAGLVDAEAAILEAAARVGIEPIEPPAPTPFPLKRQPFNFDDDTEGWIFESVPEVFAEPIAAQSEGAITLSTTNNQNTFGFYRSPRLVINEFLSESDLILDGITGPDSLYRMTYQVRSNSEVTSATQTADFRARMSMEDFEQSSVLRINSITEDGPSPGMDRKSYYGYFTVPEGNNRLNVYFDILNIDPNNLLESTLLLDRVNVDVLDRNRLSGQRFEKSYNFSNNNNGWEFKSAAPLSTPEFNFDPNGLRVGPVAITFFNEVNFGFWSSPDIDFSNALFLEGNRLYEATFTVSSSATPSELINLPTFRLRMNDSSLNMSSYVNVESVSNGAQLPAAGAPQQYKLFFESREEISGNPVIFALDYLFIPGGDNSPTESITLENLEIQSFLSPP